MKGVARFGDGAEGRMTHERPLRVLMTGDTVGGVWTFVLELAESLIDRGIVVCLATLGRAATSTQKEQVSSLSGLTWYDGGFKIEWI